MVTTQMMELIRLIRLEASRLRDFLASLDEPSWFARSACDGWLLGDVVAHLTSGADTWGAGITRAVAGDANPPPGQSFLAKGERGSEVTAQRAIEQREKLGGGVLVEFTAGYDRLQ